MGFWFGVRGFGVWFRGSGVQGSVQRWGSALGFSVGVQRSGSAFGFSVGLRFALLRRGRCELAPIKSHEDLVVWQLSEELKDRVYAILARSGPSRDRDFCDDIRRSARSAPANLSEGFHRFRPRDNGRFVRIAIGSLGEAINHLGHARKQGYMPEEEWTALVVLAKRARGAASAWLAYLDSCPPDGPKKKPNQTPEP